MTAMSVVTALLIPIVMLGTGLIFKRWAPKSINTLAGYRTRRSMMNDDTWTFANRFMAHLLIRWGLFALVPTIIVMFPVLYFFPGYLSQFSIGLTLIQLIFLVASIYPIEKALKETFDENGRRKKDPDSLRP